MLSRSWTYLAGIRQMASPTPPGFLITRGAANGKLIKGLIAPDATCFAFKQNDVPTPAKPIPASDAWLADIVKSAGCKVLNVATPAPHKDANDWTRAGATKEDIEGAIVDAKTFTPPSTKVDAKPTGTPQVAQVSTPDAEIGKVRPQTTPTGQMLEPWHDPVNGADCWMDWRRNIANSCICRNTVMWYCRYRLYTPIHGNSVTFPIIAALHQFVNVARVVCLMFKESLFTTPSARATCRKRC